MVDQQIDPIGTSNLITRVTKFIPCHTIDGEQLIIVISDEDDSTYKIKTINCLIQSAWHDTRTLNTSIIFNRVTLIVIFSRRGSIAIFKHVHSWPERIFQMYFLFLALDTRIIYMLLYLMLIVSYILFTEGAQGFETMKCA